MEVKGKFKAAGQIRGLSANGGLALVRLAYMNRQTARSEPLLLLDENKNQIATCQAYWPQNFPSFTDVMDKQNF